MPLKLLMCLYKEVKLSFTRNLNVSLVFRIFRENFLLFIFLSFKKGQGRSSTITWTLLLLHTCNRFKWKDSVKGRGSNRGVYCKIGVLKKSTKWVPGLQPGTLSITRLRYMCFPLNFAKFFRCFLQNTFGQLVLEEHWIFLQIVVSIAIAYNISKANYQNWFVLCFLR